MTGREGSVRAALGPGPAPKARLSGKDSAMGISTPKPPFDLAAFLSQKATPGPRRKPAWNRPRSAAPVAEETEDETPLPTKE